MQQFQAGKRKSKRTIGWRIAFVAFLSLLIIGAAQVRWWRPTDSFHVFRNKTLVQGAKVWRSVPGVIWVSLPDGAGYLLFSNERELYFTSRKMVHSVGFIGVSDPHAPKVHMKPGGKWGSLNLELAIGPNVIEFRIDRKTRLQLFERQ